MTRTKTATPVTDESFDAAELDETVASADLYDSETGDHVSAADLGVTDEEYRQAIIDSLHTTPEGHVRVRGRRVYAD